MPPPDPSLSVLVDEMGASRQSSGPSPGMLASECACPAKTCVLARCVRGGAVWLRRWLAA